MLSHMSPWAMGTVTMVLVFVLAYSCVSENTHNRIQQKTLEEQRVTYPSEQDAYDSNAIEEDVYESLETAGNVIWREVEKISTGLRRLRHKSIPYEEKQELEVACEVLSHLVETPGIAPSMGFVDRCTRKSSNKKYHETSRNYWKRLSQLSALAGDVHYSIPE